MDVPVKPVWPKAADENPSAGSSLDQESAKRLSRDNAREKSSIVSDLKYCLPLIVPPCKIICMSFTKSLAELNRPACPATPPKISAFLIMHGAVNQSVAPVIIDLCWSNLRKWKMLFQRAKVRALHFQRLRETCVKVGLKRLSANFLLHAAQKNKA